MALDYSSLQDDTVAIEHVAGPFRSCTACGGKTARVNVRTSGFHPGELVCCSCGGHTAWLGRDHLAAMLAQRRGVA